MITKLTHRHDAKKELTKRRFEMLIQTANDVTEFEHLIGSYATEVSNKVPRITGALNFDERQIQYLHEESAICVEPNGSKGTRP